MAAATWIVTADRAGARIIESRHDGFALLEDISHEEGKLRDVDLKSDKPGRAYDRTTAARHSMSNTESPHDHVERMFAKSLAEKLRLARNAGRFDRLMVAAEPKLLGILRDALDAQTAHLVTASVPKDLQHVPLGELGDRLPPR